MAGNPAFWVKYWGVRGSIPAPGPLTARYGGNTTSLEIQCGDRKFAIDGGTGVRLFGDNLLRNPRVPVTFFMTHLHLDHVQGFPFFTPFLIPGNSFEIYSALHSGHSVLEVMQSLLAQPAFPISMDLFKASLEFHQITPGDTLHFGGLTVHTALLHHPGGVVGYRFEFDGKVFVHCSDWEHPADGSLDPVILNLLKDADLVSIDATYTEDEYHGRQGPSRRGWGHATHDEAVRHAQAANVKRLLLFHHEPSRTDDALDSLQGETRVGPMVVDVAIEGTTHSV